MKQSLFDKIWDAHVVAKESAQAPGILYIDLHLIHEVTSPQAFAELEERGLSVRSRTKTLATMDHSTPTLPADDAGNRPYVNAAAKAQVQKLVSNCQKHGIELHGWDSPHRGVVHVIGPELGATLPGSTIVCGDSHTSTHGAFGALAFGIGTTEVGHVLASQCLLQRKPRSMLIDIQGNLPQGSSAKDLILHIIADIGVNGGTGYVLEYQGEAIRAMNMDQRMTVCNMSIEAGARAGMIAPDQTTFDYLKGRPHAPKDDEWDAAVAGWTNLVTDAGAKFDRTVSIDATTVTPQITWGTHPGMGMAIDGYLPNDASRDTTRALQYMALSPGERMAGKKVDVVFIGSCTNSRMQDLRDAAAIFRNRSVASHVRTLVVPGSEAIKRQAEAEGLADIFKSAGAEWREAGCSMCIAMNGDQVSAGQLAVSTSNRNFEGRQGQGARTILASPATAAAAAVTGKLCDHRTLEPTP